MPEFSIAICDDLESERISLARMVQSYVRAKELSVQLQLFSSGESLLAALEGGQLIHLLFLDIYMPGLSGVETARRIRSTGSELSIIFATTSQDHGLDSFEVRASDYLVKPFEIVELLARVEAGIADVVERAAEGQSPEEGPTQLGGSRMGHVVAARGGVQRTEHLVDARRVGSREVEVFADVAADYHLGNEVQLACPAFHTVENGGDIGIVGRKAEVDVTAQEVNRETIGQHGLQAVVSVQIDGTGELRAFVERHRRRELDVLLGHEGTVGYIVLLDIG